MSVIVVVVGTSHDDTEEAVRSVTAAMERAGYDKLGYRVSDEPTLSAPEVRAIIEVCEPEVNPRGNFNH